MSKRRLLVTAVIALVCALCLAVSLSGCGTESDGDFKYTWEESLGGYSVSADRSSYGEELVIPSSYEGKPVVAIGHNAFEGCRGFKRLVIPSSVKKIQYEAFKNCTDLEQITFPSSGVDSIGNSVFYGCDSLKKVALPKGIKIVSNSMFYGCDALEEVVLPDGVLSIVDRAFARCLNLKSITVPSSVLRIGDSVFYNCPSLASVNFAKGSVLEDIGRQAFYGCTALESITLPGELASIGTNAFAYCDSLELIAFTGSKLSQIGPSAFIGCHALDGVDIADLANWCSVSFLGDDYSNPIYLGQKIYHNGELVLRLEIPQGVTSISARAFKNATRIVSVTIPDTMHYAEGTIGEDAFRYCYKLAEIHNFSKLQIPVEASELDELGYIGAYLRDVPYYYSEEYPEDGVFPYGAAGTIYERDEAFAKNNKGERILQTNIYREGDFLFYKNDKTGHYLLEYVGSESEIVLPELKESYGIFTGAFFGQRGVTKVVVPECVTEIWHFAFYSCSDLKHIYIPASVKSFGERLFGKCDGLVIDLESDEHNVGWKPNWADPTDKEIISINYAAKKAELSWIKEMLEKQITE